MLTFVSRNGPPEAMICPVFLCDECRAPIQGREGGDGFGGIVIWANRDDGTQLVATTHKGRCNRRFEARHPSLMWLWEELAVSLDQLVHNTRSPFPDEANVEYVAPAPSTWRKGRYRRG
jgi:hypothetical protein